MAREPHLLNVSESPCPTQAPEYRTSAGRSAFGCGPRWCAGLCQSAPRMGLSRGRAFDLGRRLLTRKRSLDQIQYRPPASRLARHTFRRFRFRCGQDTGRHRERKNSRAVGPCRSTTSVGPDSRLRRSLNLLTQDRGTVLYLAYAIATRQGRA
jgi:hypothetical protein